jgi:protein associated with RNAse G/E
MKEIIVIKQNPQGEETWRYNGNVIERGEYHLVIEAFFDREDMDFHGMNLCKGDRFVETYYFNRWYNIFEIYDRDDDHLKGWYCNVSSPAIETDKTLSYRDLALDLLVFPDGRQIVLDKDEFAALAISPYEHERALDALAELQTYFKGKIRAAD